MLTRTRSRCKSAREDDRAVAHVGAAGEQRGHAVGVEVAAGAGLEAVRRGAALAAADARDVAVLVVHRHPHRELEAGPPRRGAPRLEVGAGRAAGHVLHALGHVAGDRGGRSAELVRGRLAGSDELEVLVLVGRGRQAGDLPDAVLGLGGLRCRGSSGRRRCRARP